MLNKLRNLTNTLFAKLLITLIILSFAFWGIGDLFRNQFTDHVAKIDNFKISKEYLDYRSQILGNQYKERYRKYFTQEPTIDQNLIQSIALKEIIKEKIISSESNYLGYKTGKKLAFTLLRKNPLFLDTENKFDSNKLKNYLLQNNINEKDLFNNIEKNIVTEIFNTVLSSNNLNFPKLYQIQSDLINQERVIKLITINIPDRISKLTNPTESELLDFYDSSKDQYLIPKTYDLQLIHFNCASFKDKINPNNIEIKKEFEENHDKYQILEQRDIKQIFSKSETEINNLYKELAQGKDFTKIAKSINMNDKDINLGLRNKKNLYSNFVNEIFNLPLDKYTKPIKGPFGWHIFTVTNIKEGKKLPLNKVQSQVITNLKKDLSCKLAQQNFAKINTDIESGTNIKDIGNKYALTIQNFNKIDKPQIDIKQLTKDQINDLKNAIASTTNINNIVSKVFTNNNYVIFNILAINEARHPNIDEIKGLLTLDWQKQKHIEHYRNIALEIFNNLAKENTIQNFTSLQERYGFNISDKSIDRNSNILPQLFKENIFTLKNNQLSKPFYDKENNQYLIAILETTKVKNISKGQKFFLTEKIKNNFNQNINQNISNSYFNYLMKKYQVEYKTKLLQDTANTQ